MGVSGSELRYDRNPPYYDGRYLRNRARSIHYSAREGASPYQVQDKILSPASGQVTDQERNEGAGVNGPRFDNHKHDGR